MLEVFYVLLIGFAVAAVMTERPVRGAIYLGVFSMASAFVFLVFSAPDVALAEVIIGSTLSTILYLVALYKYVD